MDELLIVVLFSALTGVMIGSLGTVVTFWLCGALERKTVVEKVSPELRDATIQAEYTQATAGETSDFRQKHRAQTSSSYHLYIGTAERCYHLDRRCRCYPDWDNAKRGLTICEICRISSSTFEIGQGIFVSEQGQKFHLTRFCRTFKSLPVTEYARCTACCTMHRFFSEIQYLASEELLCQLLLLQVCQRTKFFWIVMGRHDFLDCIALH